MEHIRQKDSLTSGTYTVVNTTGFVGDLSTHPSIVEHPEAFEISNDEIPPNPQILFYQS